MRLPGGTLWPIPVTLDVSEAFAGDSRRGRACASLHCRHRHMPAEGDRRRSRASTPNPWHEDSTGQLSHTEWGEGRA